MRRGAWLAIGTASGLFAIGNLAIAESPELGDNLFGIASSAYLALSGGTLTGAVSGTSFTGSDSFVATGAATATTGDKVVMDNNGVVGTQRTSDIAPQGLLLRPQVAFPAGTQTAAKTVLGLGQDETKCAIDGADPSATCAGTPTITVTVIDSNGASTASVLTAGTNWTATSSVANTCTSLAAAVEALAGVGATCTSPNVLITLDTNTASVTLAESTAACTTVSTGTPGTLVLANSATTTNITVATDGSVGNYARFDNYVFGLAGIGAGTNGSTNEVVSALSGLFLASDTDVNWSSSSTNALGTVDANLSRVSAGVVGAGTGAVGSVAGFFSARGYVLVQEDIGATCTTGSMGFDTAGATKELCYCQATNTWFCAAVTAGPAD